MTDHKYITHPDPVWQEKVNFVIEGTIIPPVPERQVGHEQLFCRQISADRFEICCIPFFLYNISLGDEVKTDASYSIIEVVKESGHYTFRVWFGDTQSETIRDEVIIEVEGMHGLVEWYTDNLLAIDVPSLKLARRISGYLLEKQEAGELI